MSRVLGLLVFVFAAGFVPAARADDHVDVIVNAKSTVSIPVAGLANDVDQQPCTVRPASSDATDYRGGTSLLKLAAAANVPPEAIKQIDVDHPGAPAAHISGEEVRSGFTGDPKGCREALVYYNGDGFSFFRPLRGADDANASDDFTLAIHKTMNVRITTNDTTLRDVHAHADKTELTDGDSTGFTVDISDHGGGDPYTYQWDFGDGSAPVTDPSPSHEFGAGTWQVTVEAIGADGSYGVSDPVTVHVKSKSPSAPTVTPTAQGTPGDQNGSDAPQAPTSGQQSPTAGPAGSPAPGATGTPDAGPRASPTTTPRRSATPSRTPSATPTATSSATPSSPVSGGFGTPAPAPVTTGVATPSPRSRSAQAPGKKSKPTPAPTQTQTPQTPSAGVPVNGILLAGVGDQTDLAKILQSVKQAQSSASERPQVRRGESGSRDWLGWTSGVGGLLVLLAAGAARERRRIAA